MNLQAIIANPILSGIVLKLLLDVKFKGKDLVDFFPQAAQPAAGMVIANIFGIVIHIISGDISLASLFAYANQELTNYTLAGGFATGFDQVVQKWNATHGIGANSTPPTTPAAPATPAQ